jgi:hypothetical protein
MKRVEECDAGACGDLAIRYSGDARQDAVVVDLEPGDECAGTTVTCRGSGSAAAAV